MATAQNRSSKKNRIFPVNHPNTISPTIKKKRGKSLSFLKNIESSLNKINKMDMTTAKNRRDRFIYSDTGMNQDKNQHFIS